MPATSSVTLASHACRIPGFIPRLANQRAGARDLAAPEEVVVAVGEHRRADRDPQHQQPEVDLVDVDVAHS